MPLYGQTGDEYVMASVDKHKNGELKVNGNIGSAWMFGNVLMEDVDLYDGNKNNFMGKTTAGTYYAKLYLSADDGYVIPADVAVTVDGAVSVEKDFDEYGSLIVYAEYEVKAPAPTEIDTVHIEGIPAPLYGQTVEEYYTAILAEMYDGSLTVNDETYNKTIGKYGNLWDEGWGVKKNDKSR